MNDTGASNHKARRYINHLIIKSWKKINVIQTSNSFPIISKDFIEIVLNLAGISHTVYQHKDGYTIEDQETKDRILSLFIRPT